MFSSRGLRVLKRQRGFTLLEVMIALVVFALSALAVIRGSSQSVQQSHYLEQKSYALWLAENKLAELRMAKEWPALGRQSETLDQYGHSWRLQVEVFNTSDAWLRRVEVKVSEADVQSGLLTLQGFLGKY